MAKLHFHYSTMNAGKSTLLLQAAYNYKEMGMETLLLTADFDDRTENGKITSRIGISEQAELYSQGSDLLSLIEKKTKEKALACVLVDEAQWLSPSQVWQLAQVVDDLRIPVICYGLRVDFMGELFPGSAKLLAIADEMREVRTICHCGSKATMVVRKDSDGKVQTSGDQVQVGGNEMYFSLCRLHWRQAVKGD
ncbi:MAG: thymidine kinase [Rhodobacteraceae bacterium]|jgi:thymidine kinase|nr:thymidine kinase [Paracoccaceae bacterium]MBT4283797.1 thymidine kinase [Paracoccaceae bacterium]MBT4777629.1 thymidine kinase [Paracoccaceae bacterium]MBT6272444.1 thymidine kinase [Paracoccaceae bacterium]MBT6437441.1 thymidine kinase [Paracoccaceae bacterium]|tara:strand:+ start:18240 stop:18821 length:582 start_codon:yes stop_codon:yes gene_type:complete